MLKVIMSKCNGKSFLLLVIQSMLYIYEDLSISLLISDESRNFYAFKFLCSIVFQIWVFKHEHAFVYIPTRILNSENSVGIP